MSDRELRPELPVTELFRQEYLTFYRMLPLVADTGGIRVAVAGSPCADAIRDLKDLFRLEPVLIEVGVEELNAAIRKVFGTGGPGTEGWAVPSSQPETGTDHQSVTDVRALANEPPVIRFVGMLLREAHAAGASDIHLEAARLGWRARLRIDGVLSDTTPPPLSLAPAVVSRLKLLAGLDIADRRTPQDGRMRVRLDDRELDLRVATVPTVHGESVVLRLLDRGGQPVRLDELGMAPATLASFSKCAKRPHGIIIATGPTGSGKTTSLYAALGLRHADREKIITVEDPVEYDLEGVAQVPVHRKAGVTFATALRGILRQDPDVLMIGEIRDSETAAIAVQAAMTGHLVFSTLHTNDAVSAIPRLVDLGVEPYMVAATVEAVLGQRLVRRICSVCTTRAPVHAQSIAMLTGRPAADAVLWRGAGCPACRETGYRGRVGIFELVEFTDRIRDAVTSGQPLEAVREVVQADSGQSLRLDGWYKAEAGITTVEEVHRVIAG